MLAKGCIAESEEKEIIEMESKGTFASTAHDAKPTGHLRRGLLAILGAVAPALFQRSAISPLHHGQYWVAFQAVALTFLLRDQEGPQGTANTRCL